MSEIEAGLARVRGEIARQARACRRDPRDIRLLCVSKTKPVERILEAYRLGERRFGESYAGEAAGKIARLKADGINDIVWHFIGPIQKNKTRLIAENFDVVESVDRQIVALRLNEQRPAALPPLEVLLEVNISGESQKSGCAVGELDALVETVKRCGRLVLKGFMGIARETPDKEEIRRSFGTLRDIFDHYRQEIETVDTLSLGMTADLEEAIAMGSTEVRIGTAIFGEREYKKSAVADKHIAFIGGGNMASCIFGGIIKNRGAARIMVSDPDPAKLEHFRAAGARVTSDNAEAAAFAEVIFLAVKPQMLTGVLEQLTRAGIDFTPKLVISMAAGFKLASLAALIKSRKIIRIMPNTPARLGLGVTAVCCDSGVDSEERLLGLELLANLGKTIEGSESELNVIGAVCGCGPAFVYRFMEALVNESVRHGISPLNARAMVEQTLLGSASMAVNSPDSSLESLREAVTSKGGTTFAGLQKMTEGDFEGVMRRAVQASLDRTYEFESLY